MSSTKAFYIVCHGLGPVVQKQLVKEVYQSANLFTLLLDETTTEQVIKQIDFLVRYFSVAENEVVTLP